MAVVRHKEAIHSGHFMISEFEADDQDEPEIAIPPGKESSKIPELIAREEKDGEKNCGPEIKHLTETKLNPKVMKKGSRVLAEVSLDILFKSMSVAYRQKLTSPKWNRFKGLKMKWKNKIRLNNVIWRCWYMQFIEGRSRLVCAFANPLDIDNHNQTEGTTLLEGKYWKRRLQTITTEYKQWRLFYKHRVPVDESSDTFTNEQWDCLFQTPFQVLEGSKDDVCLEALAPEEDFFIDTLFNSLQPENSNILTANNQNTTKLPNNFNSNQQSYGQFTPNLNIEDLFSDIDLFSWMNTSKTINSSSTSTNEQDFVMDITEPLLPAPNDKKTTKDLQDQAMLKTMPFPQASHTMNISNTNTNEQDFVMDVTEPSLPAPNNKKATKDPQYQSILRTIPYTLESQSVPPPNTEIVQPNSSNLNNYVQPNISTLPQINTNGSSCFAKLPYQMPSQKKLLSLNNCTSEKRHSPKHRILHHRTSTLLQYNSQLAKQNRSSYIPSRDASHPYKMKPNHNNLDTSHKSYLKQQSRTGSEMEANGKHLRIPTCSYSTSSLSTNPSTCPLPQTPVIEDLLLVSGHSSSNNEGLLQLLKYNKQTPSNGHDDGPRQFQGYSTIPPPPNSCAPQPTIPRPGLSYKRKPGTVKSLESQDTEIGDEPKHKSHHKNNTSSEQKRRGSIKNGFDLLRSLIPALNNNNNSMKISKAALLHKGGDYLKQLKGQSQQLEKERAGTHNQIKQMEASITALQSIMDNSSNLPYSSTNSEEFYQSMYDTHVECCTKRNWKYFIFASIMRPLLLSFYLSVSTSSLDNMNRSCLNWIEQNMSLPLLRKTVVESMKDLCTNTDILSEPDKLPEQAVKFAMESMKTVWDKANSHDTISK